MVVHWRLVGIFKNHQCPGPTRRVLDLIGRWDEIGLPDDCRTASMRAMVLGGELAKGVS